MEGSGLDVSENTIDLGTQPTINVRGLAGGCAFERGERLEMGLQPVIERGSVLNRGKAHKSA